MNIKVGKHKDTALICVITLSLMFLLESIFSINFYQEVRLPNWSVSSTAQQIHKSIAQRSPYTYQLEVSATTTPSDGKVDKLHTVLDFRNKNIQTYPSYLFEPQLHQPNSWYHLANVINSNIVYCDENGFFNNWQSDEIGFRNPPEQMGLPIDIMIIGDSFAEGACENEAGTIAGLFREKGDKVVNLARGGSGPLFQLATLIEYGNAFQARELIWIVFTGNDLLNLREEKTTLLSEYLTENFSQDLFENRDLASQELANFLDAEVSANKQRFDSGTPYPVNKGYGESLDHLEAQQKESLLLEKVVDKVNFISQKQQKLLRIVIINHYSYDPVFQDITSEVIRNFANAHDIPYIELTRDFLTINRALFTKAGPHFSAEGYRTVGEIIFTWLHASSTPQSKRL